MDNFTEKVSESNKDILKSVAPLVIIAILFFLVGKFGIAQIQSLRSQVNAAKKAQSILSDKLKVLKSISLSSAEGAESALIALPKSNPSLSAISQLEMLASKDGLVMSEIKSSATKSSSDNVALPVSTTFNVTGTRDQIITFVKDINTIAPLTFIDKLDLTENSGMNIASITTKSYYAALPKTIPTVTTAITDLTASEKDLLSQINSLSKPALMEIVVSTNSATNANPFGE